MRPHKLKIAEPPEAAVAAAQSIVQGLQARLKEIDSRLVELRAERESLSFVAIVECDDAAKARLDEVTSEAARLTLESENVGHAINEAKAQVGNAVARTEELQKIHRARDALKNFAEREKLAGEIEDALSAAVLLIEKYVTLGREAGVAQHWDALCITSMWHRLLLPLSRAKFLAVPMPDIQMRKPLADLAAHGHAVQKRKAEDLLAAADAAPVKAA